jgi:hypothetical protein
LETKFLGFWLRSYGTCPVLSFFVPF